ncbi:hypothetical protein AAVH_26996 [Aphelenchoides avenae]|nr:hypothetical protein AAVH_26996 [Aphelenchus avenae]
MTQPSPQSQPTEANACPPPPPQYKDAPLPSQPQPKTEITIRLPRLLRGCNAGQAVRVAVILAIVHLLFMIIWMNSLIHRANNIACITASYIVIIATVVTLLLLFSPIVASKVTFKRNSRAIKFGTIAFLATINAYNGMASGVQLFVNGRDAFTCLTLMLLSGAVAFFLGTLCYKAYAGLNEASASSASDGSSNSDTLKMPELKDVDGLQQKCHLKTALTLSLVVCIVLTGTGSSYRYSSPIIVIASAGILMGSAVHAVSLYKGQEVGKERDFVLTLVLLSTSLMNALCGFLFWTYNYYCTNSAVAAACVSLVMAAEFLHKLWTLVCPEPEAAVASANPEKPPITQFA